MHRFRMAILLLALVAGSAMAMEDPLVGPTAHPLLAEASASIDAGQYEQARLQLGAVLAENPESAGAWNLLGYLERRQQNFDQALVHYARALAIDAHHLGALHYQGETYLELDRLEDAEANLSRLGLACTYVCQEYQDLNEAVALYRKNRSG